MRVERAGNAETDDRRRAGEHGSLDGVRLKSDISAAGEHAHARRRGDPGFCFQPRDNNQTSPLTRRPANDWLNALLRIRAGRRQAVCRLYESFGKMPIAPGLAAVAGGLRHDDKSRSLEALDKALRGDPRRHLGCVMDARLARRESNPERTSPADPSRGADRSTATGRSDLRARANRCDPPQRRSAAKAAAAALFFSAPRPVSRRSPRAPPRPSRARARRSSAIEAREGGRLGVAVLDTSRRASLGYRDDERFPMCSTFKPLAAAAALKRSTPAPTRSIARSLTRGRSPRYAPVAKAHVAEGGMNLGDFCAAAIDWSDNTAANLSCNRSAARPASPPSPVARRSGHSARPHRTDAPTPRPRATRTGHDQPARDGSATCGRFFRRSAAQPTSRPQLEAWMVGDKVGDKRLRAGLPQSWRARRQDWNPATTGRPTPSPSSARPAARRSSPPSISPARPPRWTRATPSTRRSAR